MLVPPVSQDAQVINNLYAILYVLSAIVFLLVEGLLIYSVVKFRRRSAGDAPEQIHDHRGFEIAWTVLPMILVAAIFLLALNSMGQLEASGTLNDPLNHVHGINDQVAIKRINEAKKVDMVIQVTARQWVWQFKYPDGNFTVNQDLVVPAGKTIRLDMETADVIHAWWVPALGGMIYVNPGEISSFWFSAPAGAYTGQCNAFCGLAHAQMLANVKVLSQTDYDAWYAQQTASSSAPTGAGDAARGETFFMNGPCVSCHTIDGTKAQGKVAPRPLTHFATYEKIAQVIPNTPENLTKWLHNPQEVKPGTQMPNLALKPQDIADLVAFLESLK
ncbi:MAG: cytochrome c oxidase subunit II [Chloroflexi bacterium]|nr:cytochrome c oxidase subunit II [Chloroflexota bacterium]MCL5274887.1 cytochrome c oxidase subunit II [Chloroflexota bacterium]